MTEHKHSFRLGFLNYRVEIILTDDIAESRSTYDEQVGHSYTELGGTTGLHSCNKESLVSYIFISPDAELTTIAHEAFHATCNACRSFDIPLKNASEEVYAYMLDFIVGEIVRFKEEAGKYQQTVKI